LIGFTTLAPLSYTTRSIKWIRNQLFRCPFIPRGTAWRRRPSGSAQKEEDRCHFTISWLLDSRCEVTPTFWFLKISELIEIEWVGDLPHPRKHPSQHHIGCIEKWLSNSFANKIARSYSRNLEIDGQTFQNFPLSSLKK
jgi:hypothetical protein